MPTQSTTYNSRITDEALEKRFRDTFRAQGGAELVDDLYASGVIIPVVDFTAAAEGDPLRADLQVAWDFSTGHTQTNGATTTIISTPGFWKVDLTYIVDDFSATKRGNLYLTDGLTTKIVWQIENPPSGATANAISTDDKFVVFLRTGDSLVQNSSGGSVLNVWYKQIADLSGNLTTPTGFTSS